ncbi:MAG TPA: EGF domain-containing protein [Polyangiaceae bacterium]|nr:EGF domain-containing protein [Polyangiaceae bacterium]
MRGVLLGFVGLVALGGCNAILDIKEHELAEGAAGSGAHGGSAGSGAGSGGSAGKPSTGGTAGQTVGGSAGQTMGGSAGKGGSDNPGGEAGVPNGGTSGGGPGPVCGNGKIDGDDICDDGNTKPNDGCDATCQPEDGWTCDATGCDAICGDGLVVGEEAMAGGCDDGNTANGDGCSNCLVDTSYSCSGQPSTCDKTCGNGQVDGAEGCDDGNMMTGDGCTSCAVETGYACDNTLYPSLCADIDECKSGIDDCDAHATCENQIGGFKCTCDDGYTGTGSTCTDVDECAGTNDCDAHATCTNQTGSYQCECDDGYTGTGKQCDDVDECSGTNDCDAHAKCTNQPGTYKCDCNTGYTGTGKQCDDVNECSTTNDCAADATCTNTPAGSYTCTCKPGFAGNGKTCTQNSCNGLSATCGKGANENCCATKAVPGGSNFYRSYDGINHTDMSFPAKVSAFHLDRFEVTVSRFRKFVTAWRGGWRPAEGDGRHVHVNGGNGLLDTSTTGTVYEKGWSPAWDPNITMTDYDIGCGASGTYAQPTWKTNAGTAAEEKRAMNCVSWYEAYAFCIWDGNGFIPSEAEWNIAASGYTDYRDFPWPNGSGLDCSKANFNPGSSCSSPLGPLAVGGTSTGGDAKYGQADMAGNVAEWVLDSYDNYGTPCNDCAPLEDDFLHMFRGGDYTSDSSGIETATRYSGPIANHTTTMGVRCARP